jgi:hypothetical protein
MAPKPEAKTLDTSDEKTYMDWAKDLSNDANSEYLQYSGACTVAATLLLGFIFSSVHSGSSTASTETSSGTLVSIFIKSGWTAAFASLLCGLWYLRRSANTLFETARKARKIAKECRDGHQEEAGKLYDDMIAWLQGSRSANTADEGPYHPGYGYVVAQACLLAIAIILTSWQLLFR